MVALFRVAIPNALGGSHCLMLMRPVVLVSTMIMAGSGVEVVLGGSADSPGLTGATKSLAVGI